MTNEEQLEFLRKDLTKMGDIINKIFDRLFVSNGDEAVVVTIKNNSTAISEMKNQIIEIKQNCKKHNSGSWFVEKIAAAGKIAGSLMTISGLLAGVGYIIYRIKGL